MQAVVCWLGASIVSSCAHHFYLCLGRQVDPVFMMLGTDLLERVVGTVIVERLGGVEGTAGVVKLSGLEKVDGH